jgi:DNA-3-methyladenine glycosylase I
MATPPSDGLVTGEDRRTRCFWGASTEEYQRYHDDEWGRPVADDVRLFEKLCLEGFQSGLSWLTILRKRENFRAAFAGFVPEKVARFGAKDVTRLLGDAGIIRHRGKIESTINNAKRALEVIERHGSLAGYLWQFEPKASERPAVATWAALRAMTTAPSSVALSKDLKKRGWSFVGPTTMYALMQAMGMVNDHVEGCHVRAAVGKARKQFAVPEVKAGSGGVAPEVAKAKAAATKAAKARPAKAAKAGARATAPARTRR